MGGRWSVERVKKMWHTLWRLSAASGAINQATASGRRPQTKVKSKETPQLESNFSFNVTSLVFEKKTPAAAGAHRIQLRVKQEQQPQ